MDVSKESRIPEEQLAYARWLEWGTHIGLAALIASSCLYAFGVVAPHVPMDHLAAVWGLSVDEYRVAVGAPSGWAWLPLAGRGDYLNYFGIGFLAGVTGLCYLRIVPILFARGHPAHGWIAVAEIGVLALAIAGLAAGH